MDGKWLLFSVCLFAAACLAPLPSSAQSAGPTAPYSAEWWYSQSGVPLAGLAMTNTNPLVGRPVEDRDNARIGAVSYVLYDPATGDNKYVVTSSSEYYGHLVTPVSNLRVTPQMVRIDQSREALLDQRHYSIEQLEEHYTPTNMREHVLAVPTMPRPASSLP
jgi:hypothetical protein